MKTPVELHGPCVSCGGPVTCFDVLNHTRQYSSNMDPICALTNYIIKAMSKKSPNWLAAAPALFACKKCFTKPLTQKQAGDAFISWGKLVGYSIYDFISLHTFNGASGLLVLYTLEALSPHKLSVQLVVGNGAGSALIQVHAKDVCQCNRCEGLVKVPDNVEATVLV